MTDLDLILVNDNGRRFGVRVVRPGMRYGLNDRVIYDESDSSFRLNDSMVEFYDYTYAGDPRFTPRGQFVSRYYVSTLLNRTAGLGLDLDGGVDVWKVDAAVTDQVIRYLNTNTLDPAILRERNTQ